MKSHGANGYDQELLKTSAPLSIAHWIPSAISPGVVPPAKIFTDKKFTFGATPLNPIYQYASLSSF